ncbi:hypothetical protein BGW38_004172, partial [Lunasporangiospora selenospora]
MQETPELDYKAPAVQDEPGPKLQTGPPGTDNSFSLQMCSDSERDLANETLRLLSGTTVSAFQHERNFSLTHELDGIATIKGAKNRARVNIKAAEAAEFCFPADISFKASGEKPATTYHSFVMTQESGIRTYVMCVTMYERLPLKMHREFDTICQRWTQSHMTESEIEYAKVLKEKIAAEKKIIQDTQVQLREEKTLGRGLGLAQLKKVINESEEKLGLYALQMKPWQGLFVEIDEVWMPRCIGLVSSIPYHYLLRDWLLAVLVACSGGVEHPGMSLSSFRLERYLKNLVHEVNLPPYGKLEVGITINNRLIYASRPARNTVPIVKNACVVDLDKGTVVVQLPPNQLPPRQRRKLIQSLEQHAPTSAIKRTAVPNKNLGPPVYVKEAFPHSRLTLFCGISRVPRVSKRSEPSRSHSNLASANASQSSLHPPHPHSGYMNGGSSGNSSPRNSPKESNVPDTFPGEPNFAGRRGSIMSTMSTNSQVAPSYSTVVMGGMARSVSMDNRMSPDSNESPIEKAVASTWSNTHLSEQAKSAPRKMLSPTRSRSNLFEIPKRQDSVSHRTSSSSVNGIAGSVVGEAPRPELKRNNSSHSTHMSAASTLDGPMLTHRASYASIESFTSNAHPIKSQPLPTAYLSSSPVSTMSTNTIAAANGLPHHQSSLSPAIDHPRVMSLGARSGSAAAAAMSAAAAASGGVSPNLEVERPASVTIEGHHLTPVPIPIPVEMTHRCGICSKGASTPTNSMYRCNGCSLTAHAGCLDEVLYPCIPRGFDESGVCWSVLQMWAGLLKGYRSAIVTTAASPQSHHHHQHYSLPQQHQGGPYNHSPRTQTQAKQDSTGGSEYERDGRERLSWSSFQRWTSRNSGSNGNSALNGHSASGGSKSGVTFSPSGRASTSFESGHHQRQQHQQQRHSTMLPLSRSRNGTDGSGQSETLTISPEAFLKTVDREARPFMSVFAVSQHFMQFIQDRIERPATDPEIMFFDEVIKAKISRSRSRFRIGKEESKFLDDPSYGVQGTVKATPPSGEYQFY